jgi:hypothetical protein
MKKLLTCLAVLVLCACGVGASSSNARSTGTASAAAISSLTVPGGEACIAALKDQVYAGSLTIEEYERRALSECGVDFNAPDPTPKGAPSSETPSPPAPTAAEQAYIECATAVKAEVTAGALPISEYEAAIAARCTNP